MRTWLVVSPVPARCSDGSVRTWLVVNITRTSVPASRGKYWSLFIYHTYIHRTLYVSCQFWGRTCLRPRWLRIASATGRQGPLELNNVAQLELWQCLLDDTSTTHGQRNRFYSVYVLSVNKWSFIVVYWYRYTFYTDIKCIFYTDTDIYAVFRNLIYKKII